MRTQRSDELRNRSSPRGRTRDREYSPTRRGNEEQRSRYVSSSSLVRSESERSRMVIGGERGSGSVGKRDSDKYYDGHREVQLQKLSQFNEGLPDRDSPSMKFQWDNLLEERANLSGNGNGNVNPSLNHFRMSDSYGVDSTRMSTKREYQGSRFSDLGRHERVVTTRMPVEEIDRARDFSPRHADVAGIGRGSGSARFDGRFRSPVRNSNGHLRKDELARDLCKNDDDKSKLYLKDESRYMVPSRSQTFSQVSSGITKKNFPVFYSDGLRTSVDGISRTHGMLEESIAHDGYPHLTYKPSTSPDLQMKEVLNHRYPQLSTETTKSRDYAHSEIQRTERRDLATLTKEHGGQLTSIRDREGYDHQDRLRATIVDPIMDRVDDTESFQRDNLGHSRLHHHSLEEQEVRKYHDVSRASHPSKQGGEIWGSRITNREFETELYHDRLSMDETENYEDHECLDETQNYGDYRGLHETQVYRDHDQMEEDYVFGRADGLCSYDGKHSRFLMLDSDEGQHRIDDGAHGRLTSEELDFPNTSENIRLASEELGFPNTSENIRLTSEELGFPNTSENIRLTSEELGFPNTSENIRLTSEELGFSNTSENIRLTSEELGFSNTSENIRLTSEELGFPNTSENMLKRKRILDEKMSNHKPKGQFLSRRNISYNTHNMDDLTDGNEQLNEEDNDCLLLPNRFGHSQSRKAIRSSSKMARQTKFRSNNCTSSRNLPLLLQGQVSKPHTSAAGRDIKKRLGPVSIPCTSMRLGPVSISRTSAQLGPVSISRTSPRFGSVSISRTSAGRDIMKRLGPCPQNMLNSSLGKHISYNLQKKRQNGFHGRLNAQVSNTPEPEANLVPEMINPPEDSEDFKKLVHSVFLKSVKQLNESPAQRRRFTEQGKAGNLKCSICGSKSEFSDTQSLAVHAFKSLKIGFRPQHLGFHKALCMLMGWNSAVAPNSSRASLPLPESEALALKEDLVIWPPVVIIHNSSLGNNNPDKRMIVTIEEMETILREMGFVGGKTKVYRGKPANQSVMVVKFSGTFSGMQEAEKLHKIYADRTHGRSEFQRISSDSSNDSSKEVKNTLADRAEHVLYGYLGIAEDFDKLDFETKKWSSVKSKKDIQAIADAPLKID